jgi:hypothetical protein
VFFIESMSVRGFACAARDKKRPLKDEKRPKKDEKRRNNNATRSASKRRGRPIRAQRCVFEQVFVTKSAR